MSEKNNEEKKELKCLSPMDNLESADAEIYNQYLDQLLNDDNMRNIAVTGGFGIGKSTILRSYNKTKNKNMLFISVLDLWMTERNVLQNIGEKKKIKLVREDTNNESGGEGNFVQEPDGGSDNEENFGKGKHNEEINSENVQETIEQNLLKQLLSVCRQNDIPASSLKLIPEDVGIKQKIWNFIYAIYTILLSIMILFVIFRDSIDSDVLDFLHSMKVNCSDYLGNLYEKDIPIINIFVLGLQIAVKSGAYGILGILIAFGIGVGTYKLISHFSVSKLAVKSDYAEGELERKDNKQENLDLNLSELIYVFEKIKKKIDCTVVFEDLDRFDKNVCVSIFSKLRQINVMVNNRVNVYRSKHRILNKIQNISSKSLFHFTTKTQYLKFVYVCKDDIFLKEIDEYKFFDVILPVIPSLGKYNAKSYLANLWKDLAIEPEFIEKITPYITDYRMITNIDNEYKILKYIHLGRGAENNGFSFSSTECMAFVIYKNLFPDEYIETTEYKKNRTSSSFEKLLSSENNDNDKELKKMLSVQMSTKTLRFVGYNRSDFQEFYRNILNSGDNEHIRNTLDDDVKDIRCLSDAFVWSIYNSDNGNEKFKEWVDDNKEVFFDYLVKVCAFTYENEKDQNTLNGIIEKIKEIQSKNNHLIEVYNLSDVLGNDYQILTNLKEWMTIHDIKCK